MDGMKFSARPNRWAMIGCLLAVCIGLWGAAWSGDAARVEEAGPQLENLLTRHLQVLIQMVNLDWK